VTRSRLVAQSAAHVVVAAVAVAAADVVLGTASHLVDRVFLLTDASGLVAIIWAYAGLVLGLVTGTRRFARFLPSRHALVTWHRQLNVVVVALMLLHALLWVFATPAGSLLVAFVPQTADVGALGYTAGVLSLYFAALLGPTWYLRRRIPRRAWLVVHQFAALSYAFGLWHALVLGADFRFDGALRTTLWIAQVPLLGLFAARLLRPHRLVERMATFGGAPWPLTRRQLVLRRAVFSGVVVAALVILTVALSASQRGLHA
jgi:predicted ferric reductase